MSRVGNRILTIPNGINLNVTDKVIEVSNANAKLNVIYPSKLIKIDVVDNVVKVVRLDDTQESNMHQGTVNANLNNAFIGLTEGFTKHLELKGVGYRAKTENNKLVLSLGFSHLVHLEIPNGIKIEHPNQTELLIKGFDKVAVGQLAANIRSYRKPEPYKGKGVLYKGEQIVRKVGKTADKKK